MQKYLIERNIAGVEKWGPDQLKAVARKSNSVLRDMGSQIQWIQSFVVPGKIVCIYLAEDEGLIREHARLGGFPCNQITRIESGMDPTTAKTLLLRSFVAGVFDSVVDEAVRERLEAAAIAKLESLV